MKKSLALTKIVGGIKRPDTGRTVTLKDVAGNLIATATETPASSGVYEVNYTATNKYGYWYVDGTLKDAYGNNSPFWLGDYDDISGSLATFAQGNITLINSDTIDATTVVTSPKIGRSGDGDLQLTAWSDGTVVTIEENQVKSSVPISASAVYTRTSPVYNVKAYGAIGNGVADDRVAIQSAINAATGSTYGGVVYFPAGEYKTGGGFEIGSNISIIGDGREATKISSYNSGSGATFNSGSSTAFFHGTDIDNVTFKDFWLRGVSIDGASSQGIVLELSSASNTAHIIMENLLVSDMASNSAIYIDTPILTTLINVKVLRNAGIGFHFVDGTSTDLYECYSITNTEAGFYFDTMTYCVLNGCASEVSGIGFDFKNSSAIVLNGCGTEAILNRYSDFERYAYGNEGTLRGLSYDGFAYRSRNSHVQLNSCYSRDPDVGHTQGNFDKINMREFTTGITQPRVSYNTYITSSIEGSGIRTRLSSSITAAATSFTVLDGSSFPTASFYATIYTSTYSSSYHAWLNTDTTNIYSEVIYVGTRTGNVFSDITRGEYNGTADTWGTTANIELADKYNYAVAYISGSVISDISGYPWRGFHNLAQIVLTDIPVDVNSVATGRKLYRSKANGHIFYELATINDNTTTTYTDNILDSQLTASKVAPHRFTGNTTTDYVTVEENPFVDGDLVKVKRDDGVLPPSPLWTTSYYTVTQSSGNDLRLKASGSSTYVDLTTTGSGNYVYLYAYQPVEIDVANKYLTYITGSATTSSYSLYAVSASSGVSSSYATSASYAGNAELFDGKDSTTFATTASNTFTSNQIVSGTITTISSTFPVEKIIRTSTATNAIRSTFQAIHQTNGDMTDGFGADISFGIKDNAGVENEIANIGAFRDGGDSTGGLGLYTRVGGTKSERLRISALGDVSMSGNMTQNNLTASNGLFTGNVIINGNLTAQQYIISSSVMYMTESFSSGSTRFGNSSDDTHIFTGSVSISGSQNVGGAVTASAARFTGAVIAATFKSDITGNPDFLDADTTSHYLKSPNALYFQTNTSTAATTSMYIGSSSMVGIGTTTPATPLHIYNASDGALFRVQGGSGGWQVSASGEVFTMGAYGASDETAIRAGTVGEVIRITDTGFVGIGATAPTYKLEVNSGASDDTLKLVSTRNIASQAQVLIYADKATNSANNDRALIVFNHDKSDNSGVMAAALGSRVFSATSATGLGLDFSTGGTTSRMVIDNSGNVGINKTTPNALLDVAGNTIISGSLTNTGTGTFKGNWVRIQSASTSTTGYLDFGNADTFVGYQTGSYFSVRSYNTGLPDQYYMSYRVNPATRVTMLSPLTGSVAIGKTSANATLDVNGNTVVTGSIVSTEMITGTPAGTIGLTNLSNAGLLAGTTTAGIGIDVNEVTVVGDHLYLQASGSSYSIRLRPNGVDTLTAIGSTVGINKTTPNSTLDVNGNTIVSGTLSTTGTARFGNNSYQGFVYLSSGSNNPYLAYGNVANSFTFADAGAYYLSMNTSTNRVGILKSVPNAALDVAGSAIITGSLTLTGNLTMANGTLVASYVTASNGLHLNNTNITAVNALTFNDPGPQEGIIFGGGSGWYIYESPNDLVTNSAGNLQFASGSTRVTTIHTDKTLNHNGNILATGSMTAYTYYVTSSLNTAPSSMSASGTAGEIRYTSNYIFVCTGSNAWARVALEKTW